MEILWKRENTCLMFLEVANQADLLMTQKKVLLIRTLLTDFYIFILVPNLDVIRNTFFTKESLSVSQPKAIDYVHTLISKKNPSTPSQLINLLNIRCLSHLSCLHWTV